MKFSFVIPVFKTERYLARCLDSLAAQTDGDFEAIVVDDASPGEVCRRGVPAASNGTEHSISDAARAPRLQEGGAPRLQSAVEIVARYDARFKCVRQDRNRSTFQAKATGAKLATGDYIVPLDSDDYVLPRLVEELKRAAGEGERRETRDKSEDVRRETPQVSRLMSPDPAHQVSRLASHDLTPHASRLMSHDLGSPAPTLHLSPSHHSPDLIVYQMAKEFRDKVYPVKYNHPAGHCTGAEALEKLFAGRIFMPVCGKAIRREVFLAAYEGLGVGSDFYLNFTDDLCWLIPILLNTKTVAFVDYPGYRYWRHDDSMTKDVMAPEKVRQLAEQSRRSIDAVVAYAERFGAAAREARAGRDGAAAREARAGRDGAAARESRAVRDGRCAPASGAPHVDNRLIAEIRAQIYPTIRWLLRDMGQPRALLEDVYGADLVAETLRWDAASGGKVAKILRHLRTYGFTATIREVIAQLRHEEI